MPREWYEQSAARYLFDFVAKVLVFVAEDKYAVDMSITSYIKNDLAAQLRSGWESPVQLTLDSLAGHYKVSLTPVRAAVAELIEEGLLEKGENNRLAVACSSGKRPGGHREHPSPEPPRDPYDVIANDLVQLSLGGEPVYLREEVTAEKYGISRSAIRNILHRLAGEGVLDHIPRRGWRLRPFRHDDLLAFIEVREALELKALELARPKLDTGELERLLELNAAPTSAGGELCVNESLHEYLIVTAGNTYIQDFFDRQGRYYKLLFVWEDRNRAVAIETMRQHREILTALLTRNWSAARKSLSHHIRDNHPVLSGERKS
ncbi:colanic acid/biofilm transcriptional regulator [Allorhodopirellula heiligendammensis]|uniref:Colanic acid/biofilm transcriptional regulator n=2 Tax=Allorhodopirellula heiligendammensis TaxID=2714739 RepID=A0A5C6BFC2_9BACT|nr:colanic acid/biofilm transcriptional regulator [Allorhodopirellula heiligendammensis]